MSKNDRDSHPNRKTRWTNPSEVTYVAKKGPKKDSGVTQVRDDLYSQSLTSQSNQVAPDYTNDEDKILYTKMKEKGFINKETLKTKYNQERGRKKTPEESFIPLTSISPMREEKKEEELPLRKKDKPYPMMNWKKSYDGLLEGVECLRNNHDYVDMVETQLIGANILLQVVPILDTFIALKGHEKEEAVLIASLNERYLLLTQAAYYPPIQYLETYLKLGLTTDVEEARKRKIITAVPLAELVAHKEKVKKEDALKSWSKPLDKKQVTFKDQKTDVKIDDSLRTKYLQKFETSIIETEVDDYHLTLKTSEIEALHKYNRLMKAMMKVDDDIYPDEKEVSDLVGVVPKTYQMITKQILCGKIFTKYSVWASTLKTHIQKNSNTPKDDIEYIHKRMRRMAIGSYHRPSLAKDKEISAEAILLSLLSWIEPLTSIVISSDLRDTFSKYSPNLANYIFFADDLIIRSNDRVVNLRENIGDAVIRESLDNLLISPDLKWIPRVFKTSKRLK